jgi:hypothetical protein
MQIIKYNQPSFFYYDTIANAQNEFKSLLDSKSVTVGTRTENQRWEMHGKLKMALYDPTAKENNQEI